MELFYQGCEIAATTVETLILLEFMSKLLGCRFERIGRIVSFVVSFVIINGYMIFVGSISPQYAAMSDIIVLGLYMIYALCTTKSSIIYKIITPALCITAIILINMIVYSVVSFTFHIKPGDLIVEQSTFRAASLFVTKFAFFLITRIALKIAKPRTIILNTKELAAVSSIFLITVILSAFSIELQYSGELMNTNKFTVAFPVCIAAINTVNFILLTIIAKKNQEVMQQAMMRVQFEEQKKMYDSISTVYRDLQVLQHDLKNELLCVQNYIEQDQKQKAVRYIEKLTDTKLSIFHEYVKTGSELLDGIINMKLNYAREHGIDICCNIGLSLEGYNENDIMILFSNAIDNAIEASVKQTKKQIVITMENKRNYLCITIANAIDSSVLKNNAELSTTKDDKRLHGFGTQSMQNIIEQYDGMIDYYEKNGMFIVDMMVKHSG
ncbi:MAG: sensor histidine kinase [Oscillospiraceae bacterium]